MPFKQQPKMRAYQILLANRQIKSFYPAVPYMTGVPLASHAPQLCLLLGSPHPLHPTVNANFLPPISSCLSLPLLLLILQEPATLVGSTRWLFPVLALASHNCSNWRASNWWLEVLSNFLVYSMYEKLCEWCDHTDVILF